MRGQGRIFDRPKGSGKNWAIAYYWRGREQRESVARLLGKPAAAVTLADAERCLRGRLKQIGSGRFVGVAAERLTVGAALDAYLEHARLLGRKSLAELTSHVKPAREAFGPLRACNLTSAEVEAWMNRALAEGYARGTVHVWVAVLGAALRLAHRRGELAVVPHLPTIQVRNARQGFFAPAQIAAILARLPDPVDEIVRFAYLTGWRRGEIVPLTWAQVDRATHQVRLVDSKSGEGRVIPLVGELAALIERRWAARVVGRSLCPWVFHRAGRPVRTFRETWQSACEAAGLAGALFHDLRRTAVRDMIRAGVPQAVAMRMSGHKTVSMFARYNIVSTGDLEQAAASTQAYRETASREADTDTGTDTKVARIKKR